MKTLDRHTRLMTKDGSCTPDPTPGLHQVPELLCHSVYRTRVGPLSFVLGGSVSEVRGVPGTGPDGPPNPDPES